MKLLDDLDKISEQLLRFKKTLDSKERNIEVFRALLLTKVFKDWSNQEMREAQVTLAMENDHQQELDEIYDLRGKVRELQILRENLLERIKTSRMIV